MIILVASIIAVFTVPLSGTSLAPLADLSLRWVWLVWLSVGLQLPITVLSVPELARATVAPHDVRALQPRSSSSNWRLPGVPLLAVGAGMNLAAIAANGGTMPASEWAWHTAGFPTLVGDFENSNVMHNARLPWLGDVFAIPHGWPFANVFSVGDVIVVLAITYFTHVWCRRNAEPSAELAEGAFVNP